MMAKAIELLLSFLRDGTSKEMSSSRLIAVGTATILALYLLADIVARYAGLPPMNENVMLASVAGLVTLGGGTYVANKVAGVKRAQAGEGDAP